MSNRRETAEARVERMGRNAQVKLDKSEEDTTPQERNRAARQKYRADRLLSNLRGRQLKSLYANMSTEGN